MNLESLATKIKNQLSPLEMHLLLNTLEENPGDLLNVIKPISLHPNEQFILDVCVFFSSVIQKHGYESAQTETVLEAYSEDFNEFAQALTLYSLNAIKSIIIQLSLEETHPLGKIIAKQLLIHLSELLSKMDFNSLVNDKRISNFYA